MSPLFTRRKLGIGAFGLAATSLLPAASRSAPRHIRLLSAPVIDRLDSGPVLRFEVALPEGVAQQLTAAEVVDARTGTTLLTLKGHDLTRRLSIDKAQQSAILYMDVPLADTDRLDQAICRLTRNDEGPPVTEAMTLDIDTRAPVRLAPPLRDGPWVAIHNAEWPRGHRRVVLTHEGRSIIPGRFAIDFVKTDTAGRTTRGDPDAVADALGYGDDVLAVAEATVVAVRSDLSEVPRISDNPMKSAADAAGNYVVLDLGDRRYAVYEHLKPGSLPVKAGDRVRAGDTIGQLGFTGDSTGPHLHFHVCDRPAPLGEGLPFVFTTYRRLGGYSDSTRFGTHPWEAEGNTSERLTRPSGFSVVAFS